MAKPIVDGIEDELGDRAQVLRLSVVGEVGRKAASRYGVRGIPYVVVTDGEGNAVYRGAGIPNKKAIVELVYGLR